MDNGTERQGGKQKAIIKNEGKGKQTCIDSQLITSTVAYSILFDTTYNFAAPTTEAEEAGEEGR